MEIAEDLGKKRVSFLITRDIFYRNYVSQGGGGLLRDSYDVDYILLTDSQDPNGVSDLQLSLLPWNLKLHSFLIDLALVHHKKYSKSFAFRIDRRIVPKTKRITSFRTFLKYLLECARFALLTICACSALSYKGSSATIRRFFRDDVETQKKLQDALSDVFLLPTNGAHPSEWELERIMHKLQMRYISLVDNWDNFSSKTVLTYKADHFCVWGPQSMIHGWEIQDLDFQSMSCIGTPRFESYRHLAKTDKNDNELEYVLFVGTTVAFDEFKVLKLLSEIIERHLLKVKVIYRPHPWRESTDFPDIDFLANIELDAQVREQYLKGSSDPKFQPDLNYYPPLIAGAKFVIGGLTSMLIEAQLLERKFIGLAHDDRESWVNPIDTLNGYTHFREIVGMKNLELVTNIADLEDKFVELCGEDVCYKKDPFLDFFITFDDEPYWHKLRTVISDVLAK